MERVSLWSGCSSLPIPVGEGWGEGGQAGERERAVYDLAFVAVGRDKALPFPAVCLQRFAYAGLRRGQTHTL